MEKDYFKDRPETIQYNKNLYKGEKVFICLKKMQPFAKEISDLTLTEITANLTKQYQHPRGQKIRGYEVKLDKYGNKIFLNPDDYEEVVGRCTYILDDNEWSIDTKEGKKFLIYSNELKKLMLISHELLKGKLKLFLLLEHENATFKIPFCKYLYFDDISSVQKFIDNFDISNIYYDANSTENIFFTFCNNVIYEDNIEMYIDDKQIFDKIEMYRYLRTFSQENHVMLDIKDIILEKIL